MKKAQRLFIDIALVAVIAVIGWGVWQKYHTDNAFENHEYPTTQFGAFLAAQHAIYVNDFDNAAKFAGQLTDTDYATVQSTKFLSDFLSGKMPDGVIILEEEKNTASRLIYDAYLVQNDNWKELYSRHKKDESALAAPLRIWASVATDNTKSALKFIKDLPTNESWKDFISGQIYAEQGKTDDAVKAFARVRVDFLNISDYLYLMSFYKHNGLEEEAQYLHNEFTARPGGMYMLDYDNVPDWSMFSGLANQLAFSLVQTVSHTQIMMYSDLSILLLRFAQITGFHLFAVLRTAEKNNDIDALQDVFEQNPLFVPAASKLVAYNVQNDKKRAALRIVNTALENENLNEIGRAFFIKMRANIHYMFGDIDDAQSDLYDASEILPLDGDILALQARIWVAQGKNIEDAYDYAMTLVRQNPTDIIAWDTLGRVIAVREGVEPALDLLARVGEVASTCSSLFEQLGDLYVAVDDTRAAQGAYERAIELSDDGLIIVPDVRKKLRNLK